MNSSRPYLIRALYEWIADNGMTPHLLVDATMAGVDVPQHAVQDGKITLNVGMKAVSSLTLENDAIAFGARFSGVAHDIFVPPDAVLAIYARENGQGMMFPQDGEDGDDGGSSPDDDTPGPAGGHLRVVK
ncbi:MAG: ClpXP protease specificity-enhancing factor [Pseudomonadota bacterium]